MKAILLSTDEHACEGPMYCIVGNEYDLLALLKLNKSLRENVFHKSMIKYF
jgi:hypothetical protein